MTDFITHYPSIPWVAVKTRKDIKEEAKLLKVDFDTTLSTTLLQGRQKVGNVIPRMSVQTSTETLLVEVVGNQTNAAAQNEETVKDTHSHVVLDLLAGEGTASAHQVHEADSNATVNVQDKVVLLRGGDRLDGNGVVEQLSAGEVLLDKLLDKLHTEIRVVAGLDTVTNTGDCKSLVCNYEVRGKMDTYSACSPFSWCRQSHEGSGPCQRPW